MTVETRYMRSDQHTVNGVSAYQLGIARTLSELYVTDNVLAKVAVFWGIRVWKISVAAPWVTEITEGTPVAIVSVSSNYEGLVNGDWDCPETALVDTDAILIGVFMKFGTADWVHYIYFITEQLGATKLDSATWTVYYYVLYYAVYDSFMRGWVTIGEYYWGLEAKDSKITNFTWSVVVPPPPPVKPLINKPLVNPVLVNAPLIR